MVEVNKWTGDMDDDCTLKTEDGYVAHAEAMDDDWWYCAVRHGDIDSLVIIRDVFHSTSHDVQPLTGEAARALCQVVIDADRYRRS